MATVGFKGLKHKHSTAIAIAKAAINDTIDKDKAAMLTTSVNQVRYSC